MVASSAAAASIGAGSAACEEAWVSTSGIVSPAATVKVATVVRSAPRCVTGLRSSTISGPQIARIVPSDRRSTQGTEAPYSKRRTSSLSIATRPRSPRTMRTR